MRSEIMMETSMNELMDDLKFVCYYILAAITFIVLQQ